MHKLLHVLENWLLHNFALLIYQYQYHTDYIIFLHIIYIYNKRKYYII